MQFQKEAVFIGYKEMTLRDGTALVSVTFYVEDDTVTVNVLKSNIPVCTTLFGLSFGDKCCVTFTLRKADKLYRLSLTGLSDV